MKQLTKSLKIKFWLACGTLLGWYRQCDLIPYTSDVDFATWSYYVEDKPNYKQEVLAALTRDKSPLLLIKTFGFPENAYEMTFMKSGLQGKGFDLFFTYEEDNKHGVSGHMSWINSYYYVLYPKITLCSAIFLEEKVLVPCNAEAVIEAEYGKYWREPVKEWSYYASPHNAGPFKKWPNSTTGYFWTAY